MNGTAWGFMRRERSLELAGVPADALHRPGTGVSKAEGQRDAADGAAGRTLRPSVLSAGGRARTDRALRESLQSHGMLQWLPKLKFRAARAKATRIMCDCRIASEAARRDDP